MFPTLHRLLALSSHRPASKSLRRRPVRLRFEALEGRTVLSVSVGLSGHTLSVADSDTGGHTINVGQTATPNEFTVQVDAGPVQTFDGVSKMKVDLGSDSAFLNFNNNGFSTRLNGDLTITAGNGSSTVNEDFMAIAGKLTVNEGDGTDFLQVGQEFPVGNNVASGVSIGGNVSISQGNGNEDQVNLVDPLFGDSLGGQLSIDQGNGNADIEAVAGFITVQGNMSLTQGNGGGMVGSVYPYGDAAVFGSGVTINGNVTITQGNGGAVDEGGPGIADAAELSDATVTGNVVMQQGNGGGAAGSESADVEAVSFGTIGGKLVMSQGDGGAGVQPSAPPDSAVEATGDLEGVQNSTVAGSVSMTQGNGGAAAGAILGDVVTIQGSTVCGNVSMKQGNGGAVANSLADSAEIQNSTMNGNIAVAQGNGGALVGFYPSVGDTAAFSGLALNGSLAVTQGNGDLDVVGIAGTDGSNAITGNVSIVQGNGNSDAAEIGLSGSIFAFSGNTIGGNLLIAQGNGMSNTITLADTSITGTTSIVVGNGSGDTVDIEVLGYAIGVAFGKDVSITFGDGGDATLNIGGVDSVTFYAKARFSAGGTGNTYNQAITNVTFLAGAPILHGF